MKVLIQAQTVLLAVLCLTLVSMPGWASMPPTGAIRYMNQDQADRYTFLVFVLVVVKFFAALARIARDKEKSNHDGRGQRR